jgi:hypothetical protein
LDTEDGATALTAWWSMNTLTAVFEQFVISHISRPVRLPDLSACGFFLWGCLKMKVFQTCSADLDNRKQRNSDAITAIPQAMLLRIVGIFFEPGASVLQY